GDVERRGGRPLVLGAVADGRGVPQRLLDRVVPARPPLADVGELGGVGQQRGGGVVDEADRGLVSRCDDQEQRVGQFPRGQGVAAVLAVAGRDEGGRDVVGGAGALAP